MYSYGKSLTRKEYLARDAYNRNSYHYDGGVMDTLYTKNGQISTMGSILNLLKIRVKNLCDDCICICMYIVLTFILLIKINVIDDKYNFHYRLLYLVYNYILMV